MIRVKKRYIFGGIFFLVIFLILFFLSTFAKYWLVKHSESLIGRKLEIGELHFNYANVSVQVKDMVLFEANETDNFVSFKELYVNFNPWTLPSGEYSFSEIRLVDPWCRIIQNGDSFNFDSMIPAEDSTVVEDTKPDKPLKFTIRNIQLMNGKVEYNDVVKNNQLEMKDLNLDLPLIAWNNEQSDVGLDFRMGEKGRVVVQAVVDNRKEKYQINLSTENIDIRPITGYLTDYFDVQKLNGLLTSNIEIAGDMNEVINISVSGKGTVTDFSALDSQSETIISSPQVEASISDINLKRFHFGFGKINVDQPRLLVVKNKNMTNIERFLLPYFRSDSISSDSLQGTSEEETPLTYSIDTIQINNGVVTIADNTLNRPFSYELNELNMTMTGLTESADRIPVEFSAKLNNAGLLSGKTVWSMVDYMNLEVDAKIKRMVLMSFSPYSEYYIASPVTQGWLDYELGLKMSETKLQNTNKVKVSELEFGKRTKDTTAMKVPVRLALYLLKDSHDEIKFDIPVSGNPSEPKFKLGKIIWKTFANFMIKTVASPFNALSSIAGTNPESLEKIPFSFAQDSLDQAQRNTLNRLASIMKKKPELILELTQSTDLEKEKNQIAINLTKADFLAANAVDPVLSKTSAGNLKDDDPMLLAFVRKTVPEVDSTGIEIACLKRVDKDRINMRFQSILAQRNQLFVDFLTQAQGVASESVQVSTADLKNLPQDLRVPQFKVEVSIK